MDNVSKCVAALQDVRRCMQGDADPSIVAALDAAIDQLESCRAEGEPIPPGLAQAAFRALVVLGDLLACLHAIAELMGHFRA
jgi:hypothetical protein